MQERSLRSGFGLVTGVVAADAHGRGHVSFAQLRMRSPTRDRYRHHVEMSYRIFAANEWESMEFAGFPAELMCSESCCGTRIDSKYLVRSRSGLGNPLVAGSSPVRPTSEVCG